MMGVLFISSFFINDPNNVNADNYAALMASLVHIKSFYVHMLLHIKYELTKP